MMIGPAQCMSQAWTASQAANSHDSTLPSQHCDGAGTTMRSAVTALFGAVTALSQHCLVLSQHCHSTVWCCHSTVTAVFGAVTALSQQCVMLSQHCHSTVWCCHSTVWCCHSTVTAVLLQHCCSTFTAVSGAATASVMQRGMSVAPQLF